MTEPRTNGATVVAEKKKRPIWPWILLAALIAGLLLWWLIAALTGDDDAEATAGSAATTSTEQSSTTQQSPTTEQSPTTASSSATPTATATATATASATPTVTPPTPEPGGPGSVVVADLDVLQVPDAALSGNVGDPATGNTVAVAAVVADEAFYVGPQAGQTVLVRLQEFGGAGAPESPITVEVGDVVSFSGTLQQVDEAFLADLRLYDASTQFTVGDFYVQADEVTPVQ